MNRRVTAAAVAGLCAASMAAACSGNANKASGSKNVLTVESSGASSFVRNFNPLSTGANSGSSGLMYEPLLVATPMKPGVSTPWLATGSTWADGGKKLTLALRHGVNWSDGKPFTADDVVYTFDTLKKNPTLNTRNIVPTTVTAPNKYTVVLTFPDVAYSQLADIGGVTPVPQHIFAKQDVANFTNPNPVDTGPFTLKSFSTQVYTLGRNGKYWQKDKLKVDQVRYPAYSANSFTTALSQGKIDWAGGFVPNIDKIYTSKDKANNKYWFPADGIVTLALNLTMKPFDDLAVRKAISTAIDREALSKVAENGYEQPASPTGLVLPAFQSFLAPKYADAAFKTDAAAANGMLDAAGYKKGSDGVRVGPDGKKLAFELTVPSGYTDWVTQTKLIQGQLGKVGIKVTPRGISSQAWSDNLKNGKFQLSIQGISGGADPYFLYRSMLSSKLTAPAGRPALSNKERWIDQPTDRYLADYAGTSDLAAKKQATAGLEQIMVDKLPLIPLLGSANWFEYRTTKFTGWPTDTNRYAFGAPYSAPDNLLVLLHLSPKS
jgi:peptide/nickel transport system substrate-binding protein